MLNSSPLVAFVATAAPEAAKRFYESVLGLTLVEESPFALVFNANGTTLRVQKVQQFSPAPHTALGWAVTDIRALVQSLATKGVVFQRYDGLPQDQLGIWSAPSGALVAWFYDPDRNVLSLTQSSL
jgi:catechol 2,3-dioxygenase-like lactoylglutathione lyase family enzyme